MVDWLVLRLPSDWIATRSDIDLEVRVNERTAEVKEWRKGEIDGWEVAVHQNGVTLLKGSLHKYHTGTHNGGAFGRHDVAAAVRCLATRLQVEPERIEIQVMEFGVNVLMPGKPEHLLQRALLHGTLQLNRNIYDGRGHLVEAVRNQYYLKLYDKGLQLATKKQLGYYPGHILRIEAKTRAMEWVKSAGVATLADLCNPVALERLGDILQRTFAEMLFACLMPLPDGLSKTDAALLTRGATVPYWLGLTRGSRTATKTKYRKVQALVPDELLQAATAGLDATWLQLLNQPEPDAAAAAVGPALPLASIRPFEPSFIDSDTRTDYVPHTLSLSASQPTATDGGEREQGRQEEAKEQGPRLNADDEVRRCCQTCGLPINTGNPTAKFCSPKERGEQHAHRCRNADSNPRLSIRRAAKARKLRVGGTLPLPFAAYSPTTENRPRPEKEAALIGHR